MADNACASIVLRMDRAALGYQGLAAVSDLSLEISGGEYIGVIGPNGAGKSTFIRGILGLVPLLAGEIAVFDQPRSALAAVRKKLGYVPQKNAHEKMFPVTALEVVLMGLYARIGWFRRPRREDWDQAYESLSAVGLAGIARIPFDELSGGQQQRVLMARALAGRPDLLLLDEPTAGVDIAARDTILGIIEELNKTRGLTVIMVSHDVNEIVHFCDRILLLNRRMIGFGRPNEVLTVENLRPVYGARVFIYDHRGHPHLLVGDFHD